MHNATATIAASVAPCARVCTSGRSRAIFWLRAHHDRVFYGRIHKDTLALRLALALLKFFDKIETTTLVWRLILVGRLRRA